MENEGIINLLKPAGMTSHDGVYLLRRLTGLKRIGHTGTLDPMAVGVLPLCLGSATRILDYLDLDEKEYRCEVQLGVTTDTWDIFGQVVQDRRNGLPKIAAEEIEGVLKNFLGEIEQTPPMYSSVRVAGRHLYEYARENQEVEVKKRPVILHEIHIMDYQPDAGRVLFDVTCSKGTYIRSLCHETGEALGCGAAMSFLARKRSGEFRIENAVSIEELAEDWTRYLLPTDLPLKKLGRIEIPQKRRAWFLKGGYLRDDEVQVLKKPLFQGITEHIRTKKGLERTYAVYCGNDFLGTMLYDEIDRIYTADKVFGKE